MESEKICILYLFFLCADDDDFSFKTGMGSITLTFTEAGEQCVNISITIDNLLETSEHFSVVMGSRDDRVKLKNRISRIYIIDSGSEFMQRIPTCVLYTVIVSLTYNYSYLKCLVSTLYSTLVINF